MSGNHTSVRYNGICTEKIFFPPTMFAQPCAVRAKIGGKNAGNGMKAEAEEERHSMKARNEEGGRAGVLWCVCATAERAVLAQRRV